MSKFSIKKNKTSMILGAMAALLLALNIGIGFFNTTQQNQEVEIAQAGGLNNCEEGTGYSWTDLKCVTSQECIDLGSSFVVAPSNFGGSECLTDLQSQDRINGYLGSLNINNSFRNCWNVHKSGKSYGCDEYGNLIDEDSLDYIERYANSDLNFDPGYPESLYQCLQYPYCGYSEEGDDDEDGINNFYEKGGEGKDSDGDGLDDYLDDDDDNDGILTKDENPDPNSDGNPIDAVDTDGDGIVDYLDFRNLEIDKDSSPVRSDVEPVSLLTASKTNPSANTNNLNTIDIEYDYATQELSWNGKIQSSGCPLESSFATYSPGKPITIWYNFAKGICPTAFTDVDIIGRQEIKLDPRYVNNDEKFAKLIEFKRINEDRFEVIKSPEFVKSIGGEIELTKENGKREAKVIMPPEFADNDGQVEIISLPIEDLEKEVRTKLKTDLVGKTMLSRKIRRINFLRKELDGSFTPEIAPTFDKPVNVSLGYDPEEVAGYDSNSLKIAHFHNGAWQELDNCVNDSTNLTITCETTGFSPFVIIAEDKDVYFIPANDLIFEPARTVADRPLKGTQDVTVTYKSSSQIIADGAQCYIAARPEGGEWVNLTQSGGNNYIPYSTANGCSGLLTTTIQEEYHLWEFEITIITPESPGVNSGAIFGTTMSYYMKFGAFAVVSISAS